MPVVRLGTALGQAVLHNARQRRLGHEEPDRGLFVTHRFVEADSGFDVGDYFPDRDREITFAITVKRTAGTAQGIIFEAGDATTGLAIWIMTNHESIGACFGGTGGDGATVVAPDVLLANGQQRRIVVAGIPGSGQLRIWVDGELYDADDSVTKPLPNGWAADSAAGIGEVSGTCTARVPAVDQIALVGAEIVSDLLVFQGQRPRHFSISVTPAPPVERITEGGDFRVTEDGEQRITE